MAADATNHARCAVGPMPAVAADAAVASPRSCTPSPTPGTRGSCCGTSRSASCARSTAARSSAGRGRCSTRCRRSSSTGSSSAPCSSRPLPSAYPSGLTGFAYYLLCGLLPWNFFSLVNSLGLGADLRQRRARATRRVPARGARVLERPARVRAVHDRDGPALRRAADRRQPVPARGCPSSC